MGLEGKRHRLQSKIELKNRLQRPKTDQIFKQISRSETVLVQRETPVGLKSLRTFANGFG